MFEIRYVPRIITVPAVRINDAIYHDLGAKVGYSIADDTLGTTFV